MADFLINMKCLSSCMPFQIPPAFMKKNHVPLIKLKSVFYQTNVKNSKYYTIGYHIKKYK